VSSTYSLAGSSRGKNTAEKVGGVAALGAIIGALAGGGKGAAIGAGVGAAGGGVYQGATRGKQVKIPSETKLDFQLDQPLTVTVMPRSGNAQ
jgi:outer membrane lipoprotein SlyB